MTVGRLAVAVGFTVLSLLAHSPATHAQNWPQRTVRLIVPLGPGSGVDIGARLFGERLAQRWAQPVVVENKPGGDSILALTTFLSSDDHTLLFSPSAAFTAHPFQHEKVPYNSKDIVPIARVSTTLVVVAVPSSLPVSSLQELLQLSKAQPGKLNWAGSTGASDFSFEAFLKEVGADIRKVPYRDPVQALNDLAESRIQVYAAALAIVRPQLEAGRVKLLIVTNSERAPNYRDIPTAAEAGFPTLSFDGLVGVFGQRNISNELRSRISADVQAVGNDPEIYRRLGATGQLVRPSSAEAFAASIEKQRAGIAAAAGRLGLKAARAEN